MEAPRRYSVSPLPSYATIPTRRVTSFTESLRLIWRWLRGVGPDWRERAREARIVDQVADLMAAEMEEEAETSLDETSLRDELPVRQVSGRTG